MVRIDRYNVDALTGSKPDPLVLKEQAGGQNGLAFWRFLILMGLLAAVFMAVIAIVIIVVLVKVTLLEVMVLEPQCLELVLEAEQLTFVVLAFFAGLEIVAGLLDHLVTAVNGGPGVLLHPVILAGFVGLVISNIGVSIRTN